jgi:hypothetical protein
VSAQAEHVSEFVLGRRESRNFLARLQISEEIQAEVAPLKVLVKISISIGGTATKIFKKYRDPKILFNSKKLIWRQTAIVIIVRFILLTIVNEMLNFHTITKIQLILASFK